MAKILIAEDSATAAAVLKKALTPLGHTIVVVGDGEEAERQIHLERPDLVILDVIMPKLNGFQLCRNIRSNPALAGLKVIIVTSMDRESDRYWGMKQGADEYLTKPVDLDELCTKVRRYLEHAVQ
jgi:twitching motility two-component system response regulator PilH